LAGRRIFGSMAVLRKFIQAVALIALMTASAYAQVPPLPDNHPAAPTKAEEEKKAADAAYRASLKRIPGTEKPADPWAEVRPDPPAAAKSKRQ
jgi:hypothetical protein